MLSITFLLLFRLLLYDKMQHLKLDNMTGDIRQMLLFLLARDRGFLIPVEFLHASFIVDLYRPKDAVKAIRKKFATKNPPTINLSLSVSNSSLFGFV